MSDSITSRRDVLKVAGAGTAIMSLAGLLNAEDKPASQPAEKRIVVDFSNEIGRIKPLHGVNNGPFNWGGRANLSLFHREAGFPHVRLHDVNWPGCDIADIPAIFPLFHADADDPANYLFAKTDAYVKSILDVGAQVVYRLGVSIEHSGYYHTHPPKDFNKWAKVCVNIIRHYNEGWADGFHHNIGYWEIWNEPSNGKNMWSGTRQQYFELYETAAKAIKAHAPGVKVGGPAIANPKSAWVRPFLQYCRDRELPLDFFSWHQYADSPVEVKAAADRVRALLDEFGFTNTESHMNEWHYRNCPWDRLHPTAPRRYATLRQLFDGMSGPEGAAYCATVLMLLQDSGVDVANYYAADIQRWGMFDRYGVPRKVYYAFRAFNELCKTPRRVACSGSLAGGTQAACAGLASDGAAACILAGNFGSADVLLNATLRNLPWKSPFDVQVYRVDATNDFTFAPFETPRAPDPAVVLTLPRASLCLLRISPA